MLLIYPKIVDSVRQFVQSTWPLKTVDCQPNPVAWHQHRYIHVSTSLLDKTIHYEYSNGFLELHLEGEHYNNTFNKGLYKYLRDKIQRKAGLYEWHRWNGMNQGKLRYEIEISDISEINDALTQMIDLCDPIITRYINEFMANQQAKSLAYTMDNNDIESHELSTDISKIIDLPFDSFEIPSYQRPYKWRPKHVNQLINDIISFKNNSAYRLGSIVLHKNEIVDGQQRIITLSLLLFGLLEKYNNDNISQKYVVFQDKLNRFLSNVKFQNRYSFYNITENWNVIQDRLVDLDKTSIDFILTKCEFVVIQLSNISEAFQFFDSQNARGKDLEPHDLLKAYHLREINDYSNDDTKNIDFWQQQVTPEMRDFFLMLYRAKLWTHGRSARFFTKDDTKHFKGVSITDAKRYPFYQMEIMAHLYTLQYNNNLDRLADQNKIAYPYNIDDQIINGSRFFDMIHHYLNLKQQIEDIKTFDSYQRASKIVSLINGSQGYKGRYRTGDKYVREMFNTLLLYYIDKFGFDELDKIVIQFFIWTYSLRLTKVAVQQVTMDNKATGEDSMFKIVFESKTPYDIININLPCLNMNEIACSQCDEIKEWFVELKKIKSNEK